METGALIAAASVGVALQRLTGWESRLAAVVEAARQQPYVLGANDCLRLACAAVFALTWVDYWPRFAGYTTRRQALLTIAKIAPSLGEAVTTTLGKLPVPTSAARRGDLVLYHDAEDHLGVCLGSEVAVLGPDGMAFVGLLHPGVLSAWRVG